MARRSSVSLHDIVFADPGAQNYYKSQKSLDDISEIRPAEVEAKRVPGPSNIKRIALTDLPIDIDCDPLALADYLLLREEECDDMNEFAPTPKTSLLSDTKTTSLNASTSAVKQRKQSIVHTFSAQRKKSAMDEHERIRQALDACGFLLEF